MNRPRIGILGGTLDPIHLGHMDTAVAARAALALDRVLLVPSAVPPHRSAQPVASSFHRFAMTALAVNGVEGLASSDLELATPESPSYTIDTLVRFQARTGLPRTQIFFITGADAFAEIETWHRYPEVLDLSHFVVVSRPGFPVGELSSRVPGLADRITTSGGGRGDGSKPSVFLLDVRTRDVSSTEIRRRLRAGEPLTGLVPASVEAHIRQHDLYNEASFHSTADQLHGQN